VTLAAFGCIKKNKCEIKLLLRRNSLTTTIWEVYGTTKCGLPYNSHIWELYGTTKCVYNSHRYGKYMGQPSVDYHIIPIELVICKSMPLIWITYGPSNPTDFP
ncbi:Hypothetical predicted protein, partial [Paramuricea clavata]